MRAILSVHDKTGLVDFARGLAALKVELFSTGGTQKALMEAKVPVRSVSEITGFPEILEGRVKTLHPLVHGGILGRRDLPEHRKQMQQHHIEPIDLVVVNLYPFFQTISKKGVTLDEALENIDIGGPTMIRAAAKNYPQVLVVVDPADYAEVLRQMREGNLSMETRRQLAQKAFQHVASYDTAVAHYLRLGEEGFPEALTLALKKRLSLRYGENPHQQAAFYTEEFGGQGQNVSSAEQLGGKELSFNNILDLDAAYSVASDFVAPTVAIIKHTNPCGLSSHQDLAEAYRRALAGDLVSAYGGIVALNRPADLATAQEIAKTHYDAVIAPGYAPEALALLRKRDLRIVSVGSAASPSPLVFFWDVRRVKGGFLVQTPDVLEEDSKKWRVVTKRGPTDQEMKDLLFAWRAVKHVKSNAIVIVKDNALLGMGAGQPNRVTSVRIALERAGEKARGAVVGSDAFFPFADGVELAAKGGVTAIVEPGGSIRDEDAIAVANQYNIAMLFTGVRHFRH